MSAAIKRALLPANLSGASITCAESGKQSAWTHSGRRKTHGEVPGDPVRPVLNSCRAVILMTAFQHPHPCFLEQVFGDGTICRQAHEVTSAVDAGTAR